MGKWLNTTPPENVIVQVKGSDFMGEWYGTAKKLTYKKKPFKNMKRDWRWVNNDNSRYEHSRDVDFWRELSPK